MHTADSAHCSDLFLGFESALGWENDPYDDMKAVPENVEECAGICAMLECHLGLAGRAKVVGNDKDEGDEIGVYLLQEDFLGLKRITQFLEGKVR